MANSNSRARIFRAGLPGQNISSNFPTIAPDVYNPINRPSPYSFTLPAFTPVRASPAPTFTPVLPAGAPIAPDANPTGVPLPLGAPVPGDVPGLYESGDSTPLHYDPLARSAPRSQYTLTSAPGSKVGENMADPAYQTGANATALALQQIYRADAGPTGGTRPTGGAAYNPTVEMGTGGRLLEAAQGLESQRVNYATRDIIGGDGRGYNAQGQLLDQGSNVPVGAPRASDLIVSPFDPPEIRYRKQAYAEKLIRNAAGRDPSLSAGGNAPTTQQMAGQFQRMMSEAGQPRMITLGNDAEGRSVQGTIDRNGNFSRFPLPTTRPTYAKPVETLSESGTRYYSSGPDDTFHPLAQRRDEDQPAPFNEWFMQGRPEGSYDNYKRIYRKERDAAKKAGALDDGAVPMVPEPTMTPTPSNTAGAAQNPVSGDAVVREPLPTQRTGFYEHTGRVTPTPLKTAGADQIDTRAAAALRAPVPTQPTAFYNHTDVLDELKRRGIKR